MIIKDGDYKGKDLCAMFGWNYKSFQNDSTRYLETIKKYFNINKVGKGRGVMYTITNAPSSEISIIKGGNRKYTDDIEYLILSLLHKYHNSNPKELAFTRNELYKHCGLINSNFLIAKNNSKLFSCVLDIAPQALSECIKNIDNKLYSTLLSTLERLEKEKKLKFHKKFNIIQSSNRQGQVSNSEEYEAISKAETKILNIMNCANKKLVYLKGQGHEFKESVLLEVKDIIPNISSYYDVIVFDYNYNHISNRLKIIENTFPDKNFDTTIRALNERFSSNLSKLIKDKHLKAIEIFKEPFSPQGICLNYQSTSSYVTQQNALKNLIVNIDEPEVNISKFDESKYKELLRKFYNDYELIPFIE